MSATPLNQLPIFLGSEAATNLRKLLLSERHLPAPTLARDLNEARFGAGSYGAGKSQFGYSSYGPIVAVI